MTNKDMRSNYPTWAPRIRTEIANAVLSIFPKKTQWAKWFLVRLLTSDTMKHAWDSIARRCPNGSDLNKEAEGIVLMCAMAICDARWELRMTPAKRRTQLRTIGTRSRELAELLRGTRELNHNILVEFLEQAEIDAFLSKVIDNSTGKKKIKKLELMYAGGSLPSLDELLDRIAAEAERVSHRKPLVRKPKSPNALLHLLVRSLSPWFRKRYGLPLHETVAAIAAVALEREDVDPTLVRFLVKDKPP